MVLNRRSIGNGLDTNIGRDVWLPVDVEPYVQTLMVEDLYEAPVASLFNDQEDDTTRADDDGLRIRALPNILTKAVEQLSPAQCQTIIHITVDDVAAVLGLPKGHIEITKRTVKALPKILKEWRWIFEKATTYITPKALTRKMIEVDVDDPWFKCHFALLVMSVLIDPMVNGYVNQNYIDHFLDVGNIPNLNWCQMVINALINSKQVWMKSTDKLYGGPIFFLTVFYVDCVVLFRCIVPRSFPTFKNWIFKLLSKREHDEIQSGGFGYGHVDTALQLENALTEEDNPSIPGSDIPQPPQHKKRTPPCQKDYRETPIYKHTHEFFNAIDEIVRAVQKRTYLNDVPSFNLGLTHEEQTQRWDDVSVVAREYNECEQREEGEEVQLADDGALGDETTQAREGREHRAHEGEGAQAREVDTTAQADEPNTEIPTTIIDAWAAILNNNEEDRLSARLFASTWTILYTVVNPFGDEDERYKKFIDSYLVDKSIAMETRWQNIQHISVRDCLFLFPIIASGHYCMLHFDPLCERFEAIDNSSSICKTEDKYGVVPKRLQAFLFKFLSGLKSTYKAKKIEKLRVKRMKMAWRDNGYKIDWGVFLMRHMETFIGQLPEL
nr:uncharacterized protein LOC109191529 [Ipomoea batatas]